MNLLDQPNDLLPVLNGLPCFRHLFRCGDFSFDRTRVILIAGNSHRRSGFQYEYFYPDRLYSALMLLHVRSTSFDTVDLLWIYLSHDSSTLFKWIWFYKKCREKFPDLFRYAALYVKFYELLNKHELAIVMRSEGVLCERIVINIGPDGLAVKKGSALTAEHLHGLASRTCSQGSDGAGEEVDGPDNTHTDVYQPR